MLEDPQDPQVPASDPPNQPNGLRPDWIVVDEIRAISDEDLQALYERVREARDGAA